MPRFSGSYRSKLPNGYGLYDMLGNVSEWVESGFMGGSYKSDPSNLKISDYTTPRLPGTAVKDEIDRGFRCIYREE